MPVTESQRWARMCSIFAALTRMMTQVSSSAGSILFCLEHAGPDPIPIPILGLDPDSNPNPASRVSQEALKGIILQSYLLPLLNPPEIVHLNIIFATVSPPVNYAVQF